MLSFISKSFQVFIIWILVGIAIVYSYEYIAKTHPVIEQIAVDAKTRLSTFNKYNNHLKKVTNIAVEETEKAKNLLLDDLKPTQIKNDKEKVVKQAELNHQEEDELLKRQMSIVSELMK